MRKQSLLQGAFVLTFAALITKILGFATTIIQSRILGAEGIGLQMMVMPFMGLLMTITTLGLPVAISKAVAEAETEHNETKIKRILFISLTITCSIGLILMSLLLYFGKTFATHFLADQRAYYSLMALTPIIPIMAISGVLRGYFQGRQNMNPLAISQVIEQIVRIILLYIMVQYLVGYGIEYAAAGAIIASVIGELASLIYLASQFKLKARSRISPPRLYQHFVNGKLDLIELFQTGLPQTGNQFFRSLLRVIQPVIITQSLMKIGLNSSSIAEQYGMLTGYVFPLLFFPGFINYSLAVALVPAISEANSRNSLRLVNHRVSQAVRTSLLVGVPSSVILYVFADPLLTIVYNAPEAASLLKLLAPFYLLQYFHSPMQSSLIGLGHATIAMINNIIPRCISLVLIYPFVVNLEMGIYGVALASSIAVVLETVMHYLALYKYIGASFKLGDVIKITSIGLTTGFFAKFCFDTFSYYPMHQLIVTGISIMIAILVYCTLALATKTIGWDSITSLVKKK